MAGEAPLFNSRTRSGGGVKHLKRGTRVEGRSAFSLSPRGTSGERAGERGLTPRLIPPCRQELSRTAVWNRTLRWLGHSRERSSLGFAISMQKESIVRDSFLDELFEQEKFGAIDHSMDALLKSLHRSESLERVTEQYHGRMSSLAHRHALQCLKREIFTHIIGGKALLQNHHLVPHLAEPNEKIAVRGRGMDLVAQFSERRPRCLEPVGGRKGEEGGLVCGADELESCGHKVISV